MADVERFGGELFLNNSQYISAIGQVDRANKLAEKSLVGLGNSLEQLGVSFDGAVQDAEKFGKLRDLGSGQIRKGLELLNEKIAATTTKYAQLAQSGRASHRKLAEELTSLDRKTKAYVTSLENLLQKTIAAGKAGDDDAKAKLSVSKAIKTATDAYKAHQEQLKKVNQQSDAVKRENNAIVTSYQVLGNRLAQTTSGIGRVKSAWQRLVSKFAPVRNALASVRSSLGGTGAGAAATGGQISRLGGVAGTASAALSAFGVAIRTIGKAFKLILSPIKKAVNALKGFLKSASQVAVGILMRDAIRGIGRALRDLATAGFQAVGFFQALEIRLDMMELRALRAEGAVGSLAEMMNTASERAIRLTHWIKELSLTSPFTVETIATTTSLNLAMGFTEDMSKRLTLSIIEYTAAMGLSNQVMERIVFNFGQMKSAGKVTGTEMRDLARGAFLPLADVLDEAANLMGVATDDIMEFRKAAAEGAVDVNTFFRAFINVVERDFSGAAQRFSRTITGVQNRIKNFFKTVIGLEVIKPTIDRFAEAASAALDNFLKPELIERARILGLTLERSFVLLGNKLNVLSFQFKRFWAALGFGIPTFESLAFAVAKFQYWMKAGIEFVGRILGRLTDYFEDTGETLIERMGRFGSNIIRTFAQGMASALHFIVGVLNWIGNAISRLLKGGSPPKLLPDLPKWGMQAMTEYLKGFTLADFDVLEGIQDPIKDALDILEQTGKIAANTAGKIYADISMSIAEALSTGTIDEDLFAQIKDVTGPFGEEISELARRQVELAASTEAVREAEQRLEDARKAHSAARIKTNKLIRDYNSAIREGADPALLRTKLAEINASERAAVAALDEQQAAEADLEAKENRLEVVQETLDLQEKLVDQLLELTKAQIIPITAAGGAGAGAGVGDEDGIGELPPLPEIELPDEEAIKKEIDRIFDAAREAVEAKIKEIKDAWEELGLGDAFSDLSETWQETWTDIVTWYEENIQPGVDAFFERWNEHIPGMTASFTEMGRVIGAVWETVKEVFEYFSEEGNIDFGDADANVRAFVDTLVWLLKTIGWIVTGIIVTLGGLVSGIVGSITGFWDSVKTTYEDIKEKVENIIELIEGFQAGDINLTEMLTGIFGNISLILADLVTAIPDAVLGFIGGFFEGVWEYVQGLFEQFGLTGASEWMEEVEESFDTALGNITGWFDDTFGGISEWLTDTLPTAAGEFQANFIDPAIKWFEEDIYDPVQAFLDDPMEALRSLFEETIPKAGQIFHDTFIQPVVDWFREKITDPINEFIDGPVADLVTTISEGLTNAWNTFKTTVLDPIVKKFNAVSEAVSGLVSWISDLAAAVLSFDLAALAALLGFSPSPLAVGIQTASDAMKEMARVALPQLSTQVQRSQLANFAAAPLVSAAPVYGSTSSSRSVSVAMGGVSINNGMDDAIFEAKVLRIVQKGLRG